MSGSRVFAVSGVKNSGKTTLITKLIGCFRREGLSVAVIKHDGHDFTPDVPDTDSYKARRAGASGTAVFSDRRVMIIRDDTAVTEKELISEFSDADIVILEGFKYSGYPKVEVVRRANSGAPVCDTENLLALVSDLSAEKIPAKYSGVPVYGMEETESLAEYLKIRLGIK